MEIITGQTGINREQPTVVTLGKFDGIHRGHQKLIAALFSSEGLTKTVFTFTRPPREVVEQTEKKVLLTSEEKRVRMEALGVELLIEFPFTEAVCRMEPEAFVEQILIDGLHAKKIITGPDFGFGYQRRGNTALLKALAPKYGYELEVLKKELSADGNAISSTRVREEIAAGRVSQAVDLLGYPYPVTGTIGNEERTEIDAEQWDSLIADPYGWPEVAGEKNGNTDKDAGRTVRVLTISVPREKLLPPPGQYRAMLHTENGETPAILETGEQTRLYFDEKVVYKPSGLCYTTLV